ncbi:hypothetical protein JCM8097_003891 [Rhodosporidiobolus ruineniae]
MAYAGKSDAQIINEQADSLDAKTRGTRPFDTSNTDISDNSGVNESGLDEFEGANVELSSRRIPVEQGGDPRTEGSRYEEFDDVPAGEDRASWKARTQPGDINVSGRREEALRSVDAPADGQPQLGEQ